MLDECFETDHLGSSPRVRGTQPIAALEHAPRRIIPACAGNATTPARSRRRSSDHPRVCGERASDRFARDRSAGSSPRVRGTHSRSVGIARPNRIIPACAGNAVARLGGAWRWADHPRVCGERGPGANCFVLLRGSSPRVRGTRPLELSRLHRVRIIPACAGNARDRRGRTEQRADHPRVCGERKIDVEGYELDVGSSPRVRGTPC